MKKAALALIILTALAGSAFAKDGNFGLGVIFGEPTGVSLKIRTGSNVAVDAGAAWSFVGGGSFQIHGDILYHFNDIFQVEQGKLALYLGAGARLKTKEETADHNKFSLRLPVGLSYMFEKAPIELFIEVVPMLDLAPSTAGDIGGGIGFRYFF